MTTSSNFETRIYNHFSNGWKGETTTAETGEGWQITTLKRANGLITSTATVIEVMENGCISWTFGAKSITLLSETAKATEKKISEMHLEAIEIFKTHPDYIEQSQKPVYKIEAGQRIFLDGYGKGQNDGNRIIYNVIGNTFYTVDTQTLELSTADFIRPFAERFGIGTYYVENDRFKGTIDELNAIVEQAKEAKTKKAEIEKANQLKASQERAQKIEEGKKLVTIPEGTKAVIVADMYQNDSDTMMDYFSTSVSTSFILAFSPSTKNNMSELKKACLNFEETAVFAEGGEDLEHTKGYSSYLPNYFLGSSAWSGWKVNKGGKYGSINVETEAGKNEIYLAAAEGRYFVNDTEEPKTKETPNFEAVEVPAGEIQIIDYSAKAIAVIGETKPIKDKLKELGGKFNFRLSCGAGWIFPKTKLEELQNFLGGGESKEEDFETNEDGFGVLYSDFEQEEAQEAKEEQTDTRRHPEFDHLHPLNICDPESGQYKESLKESFPKPISATSLEDEVKETINFLADLDVKIYGEVSESVRECARVQEVEIYQDTAQALPNNTQFALFL